jgi:hypothetical protein
MSIVAERPSGHERGRARTRSNMGQVAHGVHGLITYVECDVWCATLVVTTTATENGS